MDALSGGRGEDNVSDDCINQPLDDSQKESGDQALAAMLPDLALLIVFQFVAADNLDDLVSAGQVCRHWRRVTASEELWRSRRLKCHAMATEAFTRVMAFAPCLRALDVCWINQITPQDRTIRKQVVLDSPCRLTQLTGVMCHRDSSWTLALLALHAVHLRDLEVSTADRAALAAIADMPRLRSLHVSGWDSELNADPFLFPSREVASKEGLERLEIRGLPRETTISLLRAHRITLRKLTLNIGTPCPHTNASGSGWPKTCDDLPQISQQTGTENCCGMSSPLFEPKQEIFKIQCNEPYDNKTA